MQDDLQFVCLRKVAYHSKNEARDQMLRWQKYKKVEADYQPGHYTAMAGVLRVYRCPYGRGKARTHYHFGHTILKDDTDAA